MSEATPPTSNPMAVEFRRVAQGIRLRDVDSWVAAQFDRAADEIERLTRELAVQKGVNDLAYIPHRALVESRDGLQKRYDKVEAERDRLRALLREAARQIRSDSGPCPVDLTSRVGLLLTRIDLQLKDSSDETAGEPAPTAVRFTFDAGRMEPVLEWTRMPSGAYVVLAGTADNFDSLWFDCDGHHPKSELIFAELIPHPTPDQRVHVGPGMYWEESVNKDHPTSNQRCSDATVIRDLKDCSEATGWPVFDLAVATIERLTRERDEAREAYTDENLQKHGIIGKYGRLRAVLTELLACKALREKIDGELSACHQEMSPQLRELENEYQLRKPLAWRDASAALSGEPPAKLQPDETTARNLGMDTPWPLSDVLAKLIEATDHLLYNRGCDTHGHEEFQTAARYGRGYLEQLRPPLKASERKLTDAENEAMDRDIMRAIRGSEKAKCEHGQEIGSYCGECPSDIAE